MQYPYKLALLTPLHYNLPLPFITTLAKSNNAFSLVYAHIYGSNIYEYSILHTSSPWIKCHKRGLMTTDDQIPIQKQYCSWHERKTESVTPGHQKNHDWKLSMFLRAICFSMKIYTINRLHLNCQGNILKGIRVCILPSKLFLLLIHS